MKSENLLLMVDSRLGDIGDETQSAVACRVAVTLEGGVDDVVGKEDGGVGRVGLGEKMVDGTTEEEGKAGEASKEGAVRLLLVADSRLGEIGGGLLVTDLRLGEAAGVVVKEIDIVLGETMVLMENVGLVSRRGMFAPVAGAEHILDLSESSGFSMDTIL